MAAIAYWCVTRSVPALQQQIQSNAESAVANVIARDVNVSVEGRTATLTGLVSSEDKKAQVLSAVSSADGVRDINDQLTLIGTAVADQQTNTVSSQTTQIAGLTPEATDTPTSQEAEPQSPNTETLTTEALTQESQNLESNETLSLNTSIADTTDTVALDAPKGDAPTPEPSTQQISTAEAPTPEPSTEQISAVEAPTPESSTEQASVAEAQSQTLSTEQASAAEVLASVDTDTETAIEAAAQMISTIEAPVSETASPAALAGNIENRVDDSALLAESVEAKARALIEQAKANGDNAINTDGNASTRADGNGNESTNTNTNTNTNSLVDPETPNPGVVVANTNIQSNTQNQPSTTQSLMAAGDMPTFNMQVSDGTLTLTGDISNRDNLLQFIQSAMTTFNADYVVNSVQVDEATQQAQWLPALTQFLPNMKPIANAGIDITESQITLFGVAPSDQSHDSVIDSALSTLAEMSLVERISVSDEQAPASAPTATPANKSAQVVTPPTTASDRMALRDGFNALQTEKILFESGSDVLTEESLRIIEALSEVFAQYPDISVEINGHTDSSGLSATNLQLSQLRANAVRDYLIQQGIAAQRLSAYGFGDGVPIADNGTPAGRKLNRRIEFNF